MYKISGYLRKLNIFSYYTNFFISKIHKVVGRSNLPCLESSNETCCIVLVKTELRNNEITEIFRPAFHQFRRDLFSFEFSVRVYRNVILQQKWAFEYI
jgi:hypothetical protein